MDLRRRIATARAEAAGYLPQIREIAVAATRPVWWSRASAPVGSAILHNGTMCAVNTGDRTLCITAGHVYCQYLADRASFRDLECQVGSVRVNLEHYLIDHSQELDLATFEMSPILFAGTRMAAHGARSWPPNPLQEGEIVVLGGYPGLLREEQVGRVGTPFLSIMARVAQVSPDHSAILVGIEGIDGPPSAELGGLSGGPLFRYHSQPVEYLELAGFIYEASLQYGIVFARHASCISSYGCITDGP